MRLGNIRLISHQMAPKTRSLALLSRKRHLKGKLGKFFYWPKVFIGPKLRQGSKGNIHQKALMWVKNQAKG